LFSSHLYYKVALPIERNEHNLSLLSSAPESEIGANAPKDTPYVDGFSSGFQRMVEKLSGQDHAAFFLR